jgi:hypothetical protein
MCYTTAQNEKLNDFSFQIEMTLERSISICFAVKFTKKQAETINGNNTLKPSKSEKYVQS